MLIASWCDPDWPEADEDGITIADAPLRRAERDRFADVGAFPTPVDLDLLPSGGDGADPFKRDFELLLAPAAAGV